MVGWAEIQAVLKVGARCYQRHSPRLPVRFFVRWPVALCLLPSFLHLARSAFPFTSVVLCPKSTASGENSEASGPQWGAVLRIYRLLGAPGWLSRLSVRLWLGSRSHGSWVRAPRRALCRQLRAWSLLRNLCPPPLHPSPTHTLSLSLSKINKH